MLKSYIFQRKNRTLSNFWEITSEPWNILLYKHLCISETLGQMRYFMLNMWFVVNACFCLPGILSHAASFCFWGQGMAGHWVVKVIWVLHTCLNRHQQLCNLHSTILVSKILYMLSHMLGELSTIHVTSLGEVMWSSHTVSAGFCSCAFCLVYFNLCPFIVISLSHKYDSLSEFCESS